MMSEKQIIANYFAEPYGDSFFVYNNKVKLNDIPRLSFHELLSHSRAHDLGGQYRSFAGKSISMLIHEAVVEDFGGVRGKKVLDLGCSIGHFALLMAEEGADVTAVDYEPLKIEVVDAFAKLYGLKLRTVNMPIENYVSKKYISRWLVVDGLKLRTVNTPIENYVQTDEKYDLVLMHNVFDRLPIEHSRATLRLISSLTNRLYTTVKIDPLSWSDFDQSRLLIPKIYGVRDLLAFWRKNQ